MTKPMVVMLFLQLHLTAMLAIYTVRILEITPGGHWEAILAGCLLEALLIWVYLKGLSRFPQKTIVDLLSEGAGKWGARLILLPFAVFLFFHLALMNRYQVFKINVILLQDTPLWAITLIYMVLPLYAASKGILVIVRMSVAMFIIYIPFVFFSLFISIRNFVIHNAFPLWDPGMSFLAKTEFYPSLIAFSSFLFLGMLPINKPFKSSSFLLSMLLLAVFYLSAVYVPLLIFGQETAVNFQYPNVMASDTIDLEWVVFDWLPTFSVVSSTGLGILQASIVLWMATTLIRKLFLPAALRLKEGWIAMFLSIAVFIVSMLITNNQQLDYSMTLCSIPGLYSMLVIPLACMLSGLRRKNKEAVA